MTAFYFGSAARQLFGTYEAPPGGSRRGVVLCNPFGREYLLAHPTNRYLARRLADGGWSALRFDYLGTGDSAGVDTDASQTEWLRDINLAIDELQEIENVSEIALVGLRVGAAFAAMVAAQRDDVRRLVLWDPIADGSSYVRELVGRAPSGGADAAEANGVLLSAQLQRDLRALEPKSYRLRLPSTLLLNTSASETAYQPVAAQLQDARVAYEGAHVPDIAIWREEFGTSGVALAVQAVNRIVSWMS